MNTATEANNNSLKRKQVRKVFEYWCFALAITLLASAFIPRFIFPYENLLSWPVALLPIAISIGVYKSYFRYIAHLDELALRIELETTATGFGVGLLYGIAQMAIFPLYSTENWVITPVAAMLLAKAIAQVYKQRAYR